MFSLDYESIRWILRYLFTYIFLFCIHIFIVIKEFDIIITLIFPPSLPYTWIQIYKWPLSICTTVYACAWLNEYYLSVGGSVSLGVWWWVCLYAWLSIFYLSWVFCLSIHPSIYFNFEAVLLTRDLNLPICDCLTR